MKTLPLYLLLFTVFAAGTHTVKSQAAGAGKPLIMLQEMRLKNRELLQKQTQTLENLGKLELDAQQIKAFAARS